MVNVVYVYGMIHSTTDDNKGPSANQHELTRNKTSQNHYHKPL